MLTEQQLTSVLATERRIYAALSEVLELTGELSASIQRGDSVSVQLFLQLRQEPINQLREYQTNLAQQCRILPAEDRKELEGLLSGQAPAASPAAHPSRSSFSATAPSGPGLSRPTGRQRPPVRKGFLLRFLAPTVFTGAWRSATAARPSCGWMRAHPK
ncbi:hypothetical protein M5E87_02345 [Flavonifractor plautii]|nr:hypothetical protein M5E87_02345 [Flavonifractor plautii]